MKILIISQFYTPDITAAAFRISETVDLLKAEGHDVRVITSYPHKGNTSTNLNDLRKDDKKAGVKRVKLTDVGEGGMRRYLLHYLSFMLGAGAKGLAMRFGTWSPEVLWVTSPPLFTGITGYVLAKIFRCPLVFDIRDIWPESAVAAGQLSADGRAFKVGKKIERRLYNLSDSITCVSKPMAVYIRSISKTPVSVIYNGVISTATLALEAEQTKKRILYAGNFGRVQGLDVAICAFARARSEGLYGEWTLEFIGAGAFEERLRAQVEEQGMTEHILFHPPIIKEQALKELAGSALLFINLRADAVFSLTIPSKVFDYLLMNRPILFGIVEEGKEILERTGGNIGFLPSNEESLLEAMRYAYLNYDTLEKKAAENAGIVKNTYSRETNVQELMEIFKRLRK